MLKNRNAIHLWEQWVQEWQWCHASVSTTYRHLPQRPFVFSRSSSPHPWQQLNMRGAFLLCKGLKLCWESPWHRIVLMLWLCCPWRRNSTETFKNKVNKRFSAQTERRTKFLHNTNVFLGHYLEFLVAVYQVLLLFQVFISLNTLYIDT